MSVELRRDCAILAKQGIPGQNKEKPNNDKNPFHLPRQDLLGMIKSLTSSHSPRF